MYRERRRDAVMHERTEYVLATLAHIGFMFIAAVCMIWAVHDQSIVWALCGIGNAILAASQRKS